MDQGVEEIGNPSAKRRKLTDFFQKLPNTGNSQPQEFPGFLRRFEPTDVPRRQKRPVGRPRRCLTEPGTETFTPSPDNGEQSASRGVYRSYSLRQKLKIVHYARQNSEVAASRQYGVSRSTIYGWKDIDKEPLKKKFPTAAKGKHMKKGAGRPITYPQELEDDLITWVLWQRDLQLPVRRQDIQLKATALIAPDHPSFKASAGWVDKFMRRHSLSLR